VTPRPGAAPVDTRAETQGAVAGWLMALLLLYTGTLHFVSPSGFESIVPHFLGAPAFWVDASGVAELACGLALTVRAVRRTAALAAAVLFVVVFPANIQMALDSGGADPDLFHNPVVAWGRLPLQILLVAWALFIASRTRARPRRAGPPAR